MAKTPGDNEGAAKDDDAGDKAVQKAVADAISGVTQNPGKGSKVILANSNHISTVGAAPSAGGGSDDVSSSAGASSSSGENSAAASESSEESA